MNDSYFSTHFRVPNTLKEYSCLYGSEQENRVQTKLRPYELCGIEEEKECER